MHRADLVHDGVEPLRVADDVDVRERVLHLLDQLLLDEARLGDLVPRLRPLLRVAGDQVARLLLREEPGQDQGWGQG